MSNRRLRSLLVSSVTSRRHMRSADTRKLYRWESNPLLKVRVPFGSVGLIVRVGSFRELGSFRSVRRSPKHRI